MSDIMLHRFGDGETAYIFPNVEGGDPHFGGVTARITKVVGADGGIDDYGHGVAPMDNGNVRVQFTLTAVNREGMQGLKDACLATIGRGVQKLWYIPYDGSDHRYTYARVNDIRMGAKTENENGFLQPVTMNLQIADPRWFSYPDGVYLDTGDVLDDGLTLNGWRYTDASYTEGETITLTNNGTAPVTWRGEFEPSGAAWLIGDGHRIGAEGLYIGSERTISVFGLTLKDSRNRVISQWSFGQSVALDELIIYRGDQLSIWLRTDADGTVSGYSYVTALGGDVFALLPQGANTLSLQLTQGGTALVRLFWMDGWR